MSEVPSPPVERVLRHLEVAQVPSVKELPQFPQVQKKIQTLKQLIEDRVLKTKEGRDLDSKEIEERRRLETRKFIMHDINTQATKLAGFKMFIDRANPPYSKHVEKYLSAIKAIQDNEKRTREGSGSDQSTSLLTNRNLIDLYGEIADSINNHGDELSKHVGSDALEHSFVANAVNTAKFWPMMRESAMLTSSLLREDYVKANEHYQNLKGMQIPFELLARAYGRDLEQNKKIIFPKGHVNGIQGMILFNLIQEIRKNGIEYSSIALHDDQIVIKTKAKHPLMRDRLFQPANKDASQLSGDGLFTMKQIHATLGGYDISYTDDTDIQQKSPHVFTITVGPGEGNASTGVRPNYEEHAHYPQLFESIQSLHQAMSTEAEQDSIVKWQKALERYPDDVDKASYFFEREHEQWVKSGRRGTEPVYVAPPEPTKPLPPYDISGSLQKFVLHDVNGVVTIPRGTITALGVLKLPHEEARILLESSNKLSVIFDNPKQPLSERLYAMDIFMKDVVRYLGPLEKKAGREALGPWADYFDKTNRVIKIWDVLSHSSKLLNGVADMNLTEIYQSYESLKNTTVPIADIIPVAVNDPTITVDVRPKGRELKEIDGVQAITLFNLLKNAKVHKKKYIQITEKNGVISVQNDVKKPVDIKALFQPMKPGEGGNTGYGLFTMKHIYGALAGRNISAESLVDEFGETAIRFEISKPFTTPTARA